MKQVSGDTLRDLEIFFFMERRATVPLTIQAKPYLSSLAPYPLPPFLTWLNLARRSIPPTVKAYGLS